MAKKASDSKSEFNLHSKVRAVRQLVQSDLRAHQDPDKAVEMARYMKTEMPFYGVQKPDRIPVMKQIKTKYAPETREQYLLTIEELWKLEHREEKYLSIDYACHYIELADLSSLELFESMIRAGAWWDFIDPIASNIIGRLLLDNRSKVSKVLYKWIKDENLWIRRTAILSQLKHKELTDEVMLFDFVDLTRFEKEFFIGKAIGWALREYSYTNPLSVKSYLLKNREALSKLSYREAGKHLKKTGLL